MEQKVNTDTPSELPKFITKGHEWEKLVHTKLNLEPQNYLRPEKNSEQ